jgi:hypothetical protein
MHPPWVGWGFYNVIDPSWDLALSRDQQNPPHPGPLTHCVRPSGCLWQSISAALRFPEEKYSNAQDILWGEVRVRGHPMQAKGAHRPLTPALSPKRNICCRRMSVARRGRAALAPWIYRAHNYLNCSSFQSQHSPSSKPSQHLTSPSYHPAQSPAHKCPSAHHASSRGAGVRLRRR